MLDTGNLYAKPVAVAYAELAATPIPPMIASAFPGTAASVVRKGDSIEWHFASAEGDVLVFTAFLASEDPQHTRITVDARPGPALDRQNRLLANPFMVTTARLAMAEQVAAELEDRAFDKRRFGHLLSTYFATHPAELGQYAETLHQLMIDVGNQANGMTGPRPPGERQTYGGDGSGSPDPSYAPPTPREATAPTTDLSRYN